MLNELDLTNRFSELLEVELEFVTATGEVSINDLSPAEVSRLEEMRHERRRTSWLRGRSALKQILSAHGNCARTAADASSYSTKASSSSTSKSSGSTDTSNKALSDTSLLSFPHPQISLSHSDDIAVAVYLVDPASANGIGIDIEGPREVRSAMKKFYLTQSEQYSISDTNDNLLRLWTVKESLFKSDMQNKDKTMLRYEVEDAILLTGNASTEFADLRKRFKYASIKFGDIWLSVSIAICGDEQ